MSNFNVELGNDVFPGMGAVVEQAAREYVRDGRKWHRVEGIVVDKDSVDSGNSGNTTTLRPGRSGRRPPPGRCPRRGSCAVPGCRWCAPG